MQLLFGNQFNAKEEFQEFALWLPMAFLHKS